MIKTYEGTELKIKYLTMLGNRANLVFLKYEKGRITYLEALKTLEEVTNEYKQGLFECMHSAEEKHHEEMMKCLKIGNEITRKAKRMIEDYNKK